MPIPGENPQKKLLFGYVAVAGLIVVIIAAVKTCTLHTASFGKAESFIRMNPVLTTKLGPIEATYLKSSNFELCREGGSCVRFEIVAIGHTAKGIVRVNLQKVDSEWNVTSASVVLPNGALTVLK